MEFDPQFCRNLEADCWIGSTQRGKGRFQNVFLKACHLRSMQIVIFKSLMCKSVNRSNGSMWNIAWLGWKCGRTVEVA